MKHVLALMFLTTAGCAEITRGDPLPEVVDAADTKADTVDEVRDTTPTDGDVSEDTAIDVEEDIPEVIVDPLSYADDGVHALLMANCTSSGCHGSGAGGYTLSGTVGADYDATFNVVTPGNGLASKLIKKATNETSHGGGPILQTETPDYQLVLDWIDGGANP